ncbi:type 1 glutamine amidotransferase [Iamia majanohamensis]|uniref:Type 1 glutamine amidotransferase n=1 Tax=Iamia majanohamensis TaxID=467976 RepID=A0AAF0BXH3_9ACTN|nr:type 1 glutamine amidotransferase domain-containing protein [Iamia majanohamensis]WCO68993.1 type 1 glutamine amidotransferase [Iamia majanohamensis]
MSSALDGTKVAFLVAMEGIEQVELTEPWKAVEGTGATPVLVAPEEGEVQAFDHLDKADTFQVDVTTAAAQAADYAAVVLPGGVANPDQLRTDDAATALVKACADAGTPIAVICHGPWTLIDAGVAKGRRLTSWPSLETDLTNAGATWVDEEVVVDESGQGPLISSRNPDDLPAFCQALVEHLEKAAT